MRSGRAAVLTPAIAAKITPPDVVGNWKNDRYFAPVALFNPTRAVVVSFVSLLLVA